MKSFVGGVAIDVLTVDEWVERFLSDYESDFQSGRGKFFTSVNGNALSQIGRNPRLKEIFGRADGVDPDGMSIVFASRALTRTRLRERVVTTDFAQGVLEKSFGRKISIYFLGGTECENERAISHVRHNYPDVVISGRNGYFSIEEESEVVREINSFKPDLLFVGLGVPKEHYFCDRNREKIDAGWIKTCGGMFKVLCGDVSRPSKWVQRSGLEWLYRCLNEPKHVLGRYLTTNPHAIYMMLKYAVTR